MPMADGQSIYLQTWPTEVANIIVKIEHVLPQPALCAAQSHNPDIIGHGLDNICWLWEGMQHAASL